jgi:hypothetical protein
MPELSGKPESTSRTFKCTSYKEENGVAKMEIQIKDITGESVATCNVELPRLTQAHKFAQALVDMKFENVIEPEGFEVMLP